MREAPPLSGFADQQPSSHFVNPSMLTANDMTNLMNGRSNGEAYFLILKESKLTSSRLLSSVSSSPTV